MTSSDRKLNEIARLRFEIQVQEAVTAISDAILTLEDLKMMSKATHDSLNVAKTVGTVASAGGTALTVGAALLARLTGGASTVFLVGGIGFVVSFGGAATSVTTSIIENRSTKDCIQQLERCLRNIETGLRNLNTHVETLVDSLDLMKEKHGLEECTEMIVIKRYARLAGRKWKSLSKAATLLSSKELMDSVRTMKAMGNLTIEKGGSGTYNLMKSVDELTAVEHRTIRVFASQGGPAMVEKVTSSLFSKFTLAANVAVSVWEVYQLIRHWDQDPATDVVDKAISTLLEEREALESLVSGL